MMLFQVSESTAAQRRWFFACVDNTDGVTPETGLTFSGAELQISKNGAAFASFAGTATELSDGLYYYEATAGELDTNGAIGFKVEKTGVRLVLMSPGQVVPWDPYDAVRLGATALPNANAEAAGGLYTRGTGAGQINQPANGMVDVNAVRHLGTAYSAPTVAGVPNVNVKTWNDLATVALPLVPTTAGRTLDVSAGGEAGIDWANVGSPTTTVGLTNTTVGTLTALATDAISAAAVSSAAVTKIVAGVFAYTLRSGRTFMGHARRMDSLFFGKVTGLVGSLVTGYQPDEATTEFTSAQNVTSGTREKATVTNSETP